MFKPIAAACGLALLSVPAASFAQSETITVMYEDLDLASKSGQKELDRRIATAAEEYCEANTLKTGTRLGSSKTKKCIRDTKAAFDRQFAGMIRDAKKGG